MIEIVQLKDASEGNLQDINFLLAQLRLDTGGKDAVLSELEEIVSDKNVVLMIVKDDERIIGMATLYMITKFGKRSAFLEDVVIDEGYRGQHLGENLMLALIDVARIEHIHTIHLTSRPERAAANKLYQKLGFEQKQTNVYRMKL